METTIITRRIEVYVNEADKELRKEYEQRLMDFAYYSRKAANLVASNQYWLRNQQQTELYLDPEYRGKLVSREKNQDGILNCSLDNTTYRIVSSQFKGKMPMDSASMVNNVVVKALKKRWPEILKGESSLPSWRNTFPVQIPKQNNFDPFNLSDDGRNVSFTALKIPFATRLGRDRSNNAIILKKIITGEYRLLDSSIGFSKNKEGKKKTYLNAVIELPVRKNQLDYEKVLGMNLGLIHPAVVCTSVSDKPFFIGNTEEFLYKRRQIQEGRKRLQIALKYNKGGGGGKKKLAKLEDYKQYEANYVTTKNHQYSREIVDFAVKHNCGIIRIEDFKGISRSQDYMNKLILRNWSYYQLQSMIEYKATKEGIKVLITSPKGLSQKCIKCGHIHADNRIGSQHFKCSACGFEELADYVHAYNMARAAS